MGSLFSDKKRSEIRRSSFTGVITTVEKEIFEKVNGGNKGITVNRTK